MKRLNKKQRHKLYKDALDILLSTSENHYFGPIKYNWGNWCICDCIINILNPNCKKYNPEKLQESLCEFNLFKPANTCSYWFDGKEGRVICLGNYILI